MKNILKYFALASAMVLGFAACDKTEAPEYEAAPVETGAQVFFQKAPAATVKLTKEAPSLNITVSRGNVAEALEVPVAASGEATTWFNVPSKVSFSAEQKDAVLTVSAKDVANMEMNVFYPLTLKLDESLVSLYGAGEISFEIGIELPWILFDAGTIYETPYWGEQEDIPIYYQQISEKIRYCVVSGCFGHDTIAGGGEYDVQPYTWYWNTETNALYIPVQWMGYENGNGKTWFSDEPAFYNLYWAMKNGAGYGAGTFGEGAGQVEGSDAWFEFCDAFRAKYPEDYYPYYDGAGKFYLADQYIAGYPGDSDAYKGRYGTDGNDMYMCSFAADYTIALSYEGVLLDKNGEEQIIGDLTFEGADVKNVYVLLVEGKDPSVAVGILEADGVNLEEVPNLVLVNKAGEFRVPMIAEAEPGKYTMVAVPMNGEGGFEWDYAVYETFQYGPVLDPLAVEYSAEDIIGGVSKEYLCATQWVAFAAGYNGDPSERQAVAYANFADVEDTAADMDIVSCSGLANTTAFSDTFIMEWYQGYLYFLNSTNASTGATWNGYNVVPMAYGENFAGNYAYVGGYVADGIYAFVNNSGSDFVYGFAFWAETGGQIAGYLKAFEYLILVDPAILAAGDGAPRYAPAHIMLHDGIPFSNEAIDSVRHSLNGSHDWSKDVVASGKVFAFNAKGTEISTATK